MIRILELFGGIGAIRKAFERQNIPHKVIDYVEIDKYAVKSYNAMFNENFEVQDITTWNKDIDVDFIMHGSPCQDFSVAGKQAGGDLGSGTRSSLMYETIRIVGKLRPKYVMWENVKNLLSKKHKHNFDAYIETMNILGYNSYYQVLNAKDYGIPQNRERVYTISIRKDIDDRKFTFPEKQELKLRLKDLLEYEVDKKYYLSGKMINYITADNEEWNGSKKSVINKTIASAINTGEGSRRCDSSNYFSDNFEDDVDIKKLPGAYGRKFGSKGKLQNEICDTLQAAMGNGGGNVPLLKCVGNLSGGKWDKIYENCRRVYSEDGISPTIPTCQGGNTEPKVETSIDNFEKLHIRKLTPKECWRLMGFDDEDFEKAKSVPMSDTQLYKQAGNSIVVNVLEKILLNLF